MKLNIQATESELKESPDKWAKALSQVFEHINPEVSDRLLKAIVPKDILFTEPVLIEITKQWELSYKKQTDDMLNAIYAVLEKALKPKRIPAKAKLTLKKSSDSPWIGVDLDGTLAEYTEYKGPDYIGKPIIKMVDRVKGWLKEDKDVRIFTARANPENNGSDASDLAIDTIRSWCATIFDKKLPVVYQKDLNMIELWDDRAVQVITNTGNRVGPDHG